MKKILTLSEKIHNREPSISVIDFRKIKTTISNVIKHKTKTHFFVNIN